MKKLRLNFILIIFISGVTLFSCKTTDLSVPIDSGKVAEDYAKNKRKSNRKYLYKELIITGQLKEIYKNKNNETVLYISDNKSKKSIKCILDKEKQAHGGPMKLDMNLKIKGFCVGLFDEVEMKKCVILDE